MDRWINKVAIITGASSGIGENIVRELVKKNLKVVGLARRIENMEKIRMDLKNETGTFYPIKCDVSKEEDIIEAFQWVEKNFESVDILINNAGVYKADLCIESSTENLKKVIDVNLIAPTICTREAVKIMRANNTAGHIINIDSILGQNVGFYNTHAGAMYSPSKFALKAVSQIVELELEHVECSTKVTTIFPGLVKTEMAPEIAYKLYPYIDSKDISESIIYVLSTPPHVQIKELTITAVPGYKLSIKMERWINKVAVITGASSGIGAKIVKELVKKNVKVVGLARRMENMEKIKIELKDKGKLLFFPLKCDISKEDDILKSFKWIEENLKSVDILVNNAAVNTNDLCIEISTETIKNVLDVNLIGPTICIKEAVRIMKEKNSAGHIFNICSVLGQNIQIFHGITFNLYGPSKFALKAISDVVELELESIKSPVKVTTIYPGLVKTEMPPQAAFKMFPYLDPDDISDAVMYALSTPPHVQVKELTITPLQTYQRKTMDNAE
ncbi:uncharacterized protein LOC127289210 [Leptopilina boulardi]|uniref:uncharacterized protein LOC127289210 n=1 Tax=Leptopilina boulardi TaxID=63433 RepID=UPI0021F6568C|nr:uncharacterized protein LOC127289210 [Leptopilina boulardi]